MSISSRTSDQSGSKRRKVVGEVSYFGLTDCGCVRPLNEDAWYASPEDGLFLVSDGMGGESAGALASEIVVEVLPLMIRQRLKGVTGLAMETRKRVCAALVDLSVELRRRTQGQSGLDGAGATIVLALVRGRHAVIAHLGDVNIQARIRVTKNDFNGPIFETTLLVTD